MRRQSRVPGQPVPPRQPWQFPTARGQVRQRRVAGRPASRAPPASSPGVQPVRGRHPPPPPPPRRLPRPRPLTPGQAAPSLAPPAACPPLPGASLPRPQAPAHLCVPPRQPEAAQADVIEDQQAGRDGDGLVAHGAVHHQRAARGQRLGARRARLACGGQGRGGRDKEKGVDRLRYGWGARAQRMNGRWHGWPRRQAPPSEARWASLAGSRSGPASLAPALGPPGAAPCLTRSPVPAWAWAGLTPSAPAGTAPPSSPRWRPARAARAPPPPCARVRRRREVGGGLAATTATEAPRGQWQRTEVPGRAMVQAVVVAWRPPAPPTKHPSPLSLAHTRTCLVGRG